FEELEKKNKTDTSNLIAENAELRDKVTKLEQKQTQSDSGNPCPTVVSEFPDPSLPYMLQKINFVLLSPKSVRGDDSTQTLVIES
ncbi:15097_t:CDS:2, partial [Acaulospora colombiana]